MVTAITAPDDATEIGQIVTTTDQVIVHVNPAICALLDREPAELLGARALSFTYGVDLERNGLLLDRLAQSTGPAFAITKRYVRSDASLVWVRNHVSSIGNGTGGRLLCATCEPTAAPFGSNALSRRHAAALQLCCAFVRGKALLGSHIVSAPPAEALLWLYRAELEGKALTVDDLARLTSTAVATMRRWLSMLLDHALVERSSDLSLSPGSTLRISRACEVALDSLLAELEH